MTGFPRRGEIYYADLDPVRGSEQAGERPVLIVSNDVQNEHSSTVTVVPITTTVYDRKISVNVELPAGLPLQRAGTAKCHQVRTISKERLDNLKGELTADQMAQVEQALLVVFGIRAP